ncbi:hypothetical protein BOX15_Mlig002364g2 [Macrostomum lignano]|uniref:EF-hand domain-containing protein n=2 Tax=Macrostomum lignano TaxID=282301 RepID=A0A267DRV5_9PLAT|nr:hypothetical protein BOX15_Mlig002364g2 [Macrostomum lignano]
MTQEQFGSSLAESQRAASLFSLLDTDGSGFITESDLARCCDGDLRPDEVRQIFAQLDEDGDGRVDAADFQAGFRAIGLSLASRELHNQHQHHHQQLAAGQAGSSLSMKAFSQERLLDVDEPQELRQPPQQRSGASGADLEQQLTEGLQQLSCQEKVCELHCLLQRQYPQLVDSFESIIVSAAKEVGAQRRERQQLEEAFARAKAANESHVRQLEEEMEIQMTKLEQRARAQERRRLAEQYQDLLDRKQAEIDELQTMIDELQRRRSRQDVADATSEVGLRRSVEETRERNQSLLADMQRLETALAVSRSELARMRQDQEGRTRELLVERRNLQTYQRDQEQLALQLRLLQQANRSLSDTNDSLRCALERQYSGVSSGGGGGGAVTPSSGRGSFCRPVSSVGTAAAAEEFCEDGVERRVGLSTELDEDDEEVDSGMSTCRDDQRQSMASAADFPDHFVIPFGGSGGKGFGYDFTDEEVEEDEEGLHSTRETLVDCGARERSSATAQQLDDCYMYSEAQEDGEVIRHRQPLRSSRRHRQLRRCPQPHQMGYPEEEEEGAEVDQAESIAESVAMSPPERMFKVVLAGDAAVGKSSFIGRFCDGRFSANTTATLGVDFKTRTLVVDGRVVAVQLWDTAGQERFRSIAKSYFRRADGVILMYDCTHERSFLSARDWMESIRDCAEPGIPVVLAGNKADLRGGGGTGRGVDASEGARLAESLEAAMFVETSAASGLAVSSTVEQLCRLLWEREDAELMRGGGGDSSGSVQLKDGAGKKLGSCC